MEPGVPVFRRDPMLKPVLTLAAIGFVGFALLKLLPLLLLPLFGIFFFVMKIAVIAGLIWLAFWFFNKRGKSKDEPTTE